MTIGKLSSTLLLLLLFCIKHSHSGVKKIKIHVPYYVKHVHHYKKVYVPKIHVIKHEHHHKKEYDHHHHHHEVYKHWPYRSYDKSSNEFPDEFAKHDVYYGDIESKSYRGSERKKLKPFGYRGRFSEQFRGWKDVDGSDYSGEEEEDYSAYRKNFYFKRRSGSGEEDEEDEEERGGGEEEEEEEEEDSDEGDEENNKETTNDSLAPVRQEEEMISITTTGNPLQ